MRSTTILCCSESYRLPTAVLSSHFFDDAASFSCEQLITCRSLKSGFSESHLRGRWCSSVFLYDLRDFSKRRLSGLLFFFFSSSTQLRRLSLFSVPWSSASGPRRHSTRTTLNLRPLRPRTRGMPLGSKPLIQDPSDNARGLPQGSRPNTAPGPHAHSRPAPTNRRDLPRF